MTNWPFGVFVQVPTECHFYSGVASKCMYPLLYPEIRCGGGIAPQTSVPRGTQSLSRHAHFSGSIQSQTDSVVRFICRNLSGTAWPIERPQQSLIFAGWNNFATRATCSRFRKAATQLKTSKERLHKSCCLIRPSFFLPHARTTIVSKAQALRGVTAHPSTTMRQLGAFRCAAKAVYQSLRTRNY